MVAEGGLDAVQLSHVAHRRRSAVRIDQVDILGFEARIVDRIAHRLACTEPFGMRCGQVVSVGAHAAAGYFGINLGPACLGVLILFEDQRTGTFTDHEPVAVRVERTRCVRRIVIAGRKGLHGVESPYSGRVDSGFRATGHNDVGTSQTDVGHRIDHRVVRRRACGNRTIVRPPETVFHRNLAGAHIRDHLGDEERAISGDFASLDIALYLLVECLQSTYA